LIELIPHPERTVDVMIVRHGQTDWNHEARIMGARPIPLNDVGESEVRAAAATMRGFTPDLCVTSPVARVLRTAEILFSELGWTAPRDTDGRLTEFNMGAWEGQRMADLRGLPGWGAYLSAPQETVFPGGESLREIQARAAECLNAVVAQGLPRVVLITHGGIVRLLGLSAVGAPLSSYHRTSVPTGSATLLRLRPGRPAQLRCFGATGSLEP
jgi:broad specificity phosphatase PhoE